MLDLLIRGGEVVTPQGVGKWSVGVQGEKIVFIGTEEHAPQAGRTVDAGRDKICGPGRNRTSRPSRYLRSHQSWRRREHARPRRRHPWHGVRRNDYAPGLLLHRAGNGYHRRDRGAGGAMERAIICRLLFPCRPDGRASDQRVRPDRRRNQARVPKLQDFYTDAMLPHPKRVSLRLDMGRVQLAMEKVAKHDGIMVVHAEDDDLGGELFVIELSH